jgi:hypothetical protein
LSITLYNPIYTLTCSYKSIEDIVRFKKSVSQVSNSTSSSEMSEDDEYKSDECSEEVCEVCGGSPCEWKELGPEVVKITEEQFSWSDNGVIVLDEDGTPIERSTVRKAMYKLFTYLKFGHLGRGNRIPLPYGVIKEIRKRYPELDGNYIGFHKE